MDDLEQALNAGRTEGAEPPPRGSTEADGACARGDRHHEIGAAPEAAVDEHGSPVADGIDGFRQHLERRRQVVHRASTVI